MRKYQADGQKPMYDLLMQRNEQEIFNKFATDKPRYVAEQFTGPALSLKSTKSPKNDLGAIMFPNNNIYLSKIGGLARESSPIQDAIKNVRAQNSAFVNLPDTDFKVLEAAGRHLDDGVRLNRFPAGGAEDNNVRQLYKLMDELQPEFPSYRDTLDVRYNREVAKISQTVRCRFMTESTISAAEGWMCRCLSASAAIYQNTGSNSFLTAVRK